MLMKLRASITLILLFISSSLCFYQSGYLILDLQSTTETDFSTELTSWNDASSLPSTNDWTQCGTIYLFAGYGYTTSSGSFQRVYDNLPTHQSVALSFEIYIIDADGSEFPYFTFGSSSMFGFGLNSISLLTTSLCGSGAINDLAPVTVLAVAQHSGSTFSFDFMMASNNLGMRNIKLLFETTDISATVPSCFIADPLSVFSMSACPCPEGQYSDGGTCTPCDDACENCFGGDASSCYSIKDGYYFDGTTSQQCDSSCETCSGAGATACLTCPWGVDADANFECILVCDEACSACTGTTFDTCSACNDGYYFDGMTSCLPCDNSCETCSTAGPSACLTCPWGDPADANSQCILVCDEACSTCTGTTFDTCSACNDGYYFDGATSCLECDNSCETCSSSGPSACLTCPWGDPADVNSQCILVCDEACSTCTGTTANTCSACNDGYYFDGTSSCLQCDNTCETCSSSGPSACLTCPSGDAPDANSQCIVNSSSPPPSEPAEPPVKPSTRHITDTKKKTQTIVGAGLIANTVVRSGSSGAIRISMLAQMIDYIKYLKIDYPYDVQYAISTWDGDLINFNSDSLDLTPNSFENYGSSYAPLPPQITRYDDDIDSSFLMNFWDELIPMFILAGLLIFLIIFEVFFSKTVQRETPKKILHHLKILVQGLLITYLYDDFADIFFFAILSYKTTKKTTALTVANIIVSMLFIIGAITALIGQTWLVKKYQTLKTKDKEEFEKFESKIEGVKILWKDFKDESFFQMDALLFTVLHSILFCIILATLIEHPLVQVILINILSIAIIIYLVWFQPFDEKLELIQTIVCEAILLAVNLCLLILISLDSNSKSREAVGEAILVLTMIFNFVPLVCLAITAIEIIKKTSHAVKNYLLIT